MSSNPFAEPYKQLRESYYSTIDTQVAKNMKVSGPHELTDEIEASYERLAKALNRYDNTTFSDRYEVDPAARTMRSLLQNVEATAGYIPMKRSGVQLHKPFETGFEKPDTFEGGTTSMSEDYLLEYVDEDKRKEREARTKHLDYKDEVRTARRAWLKKANKNYGKSMDEEFELDEANRGDMGMSDEEKRSTRYARGGASYMHPLTRGLRMPKGMKREEKYGVDKEGNLAGKYKKLREDKDPCWAGYEMVGMKKKGNREVPNCVPKKSMKESYEDYIIENIDELVIYVSNSLSVPVSYATKMVGDMSIEEALDILDECMDKKPCKKCKKTPCGCMK